MKVLVAEDDPVSRRVLDATLSGWGYEVVPCSDGSQAWQALTDEGRPELAILDWTMPGMDGLEVCRRVRRSAEQSAVYIILLTARGGREDIIAGLDAGADDHISKPFDVHELWARVRVGERLIGLQKRRLKEEAARYIEQLEELVEELRRSRRRIVVAHEEAKRSIAERLHGTVQTELFMLNLKLDEVAESLDMPDAARGDLAEVVSRLDSVRENEIRGISHLLHPSIVGVGLAAGIRSLRDRYEKWLPVPLDISRDILDMETGGGSAIPFDVRLALYRVADEALANSVKHARASRVAVSLSRSDRASEICLGVRDDGIGFEPDECVKGLGMETIEDYLGALGGSMRLETSPGAGTNLIATAPLDVDSGHPRSD